MDSSINILCFGDSNTYGTVPMEHPHHDERFSPTSRWTGVMRQKLGAGFHVIEEGLPGRTTVHDDAIEGASRNGKTYLTPCLGSHKPLDAIVICLGTNDLKTRFSLTPEDISRGFQSLLDVIVASGCGRDGGRPRLLVIAPAPIEEIGFLGEIFVGGVEKSKRLAAKYEQLASENGAHFVDAGLIIQVSKVDGIHFDEDQHRLLGNAVADAVTAMFSAH
jgi:lysophospholipase L1-like esterase